MIYNLLFVKLVRTKIESKSQLEFEELDALKTKRKAINQTLAAMDKGIYQTALF